MQIGVSEQGLLLILMMEQMVLLSAAVMMRSSFLRFDAFRRMKGHRGGSRRFRFDIVRIERNRMTVKLGSRCRSSNARRSNFICFRADVEVHIDGGSGHWRERRWRGWSQWVICNQFVERSIGTTILLEIAIYVLIRIRNRNIDRILL